MEKYITWYKLQLKAWLKQKACYLQLLIVSLLLIIFVSTTLPTYEHNKAGICNMDGNYATAIIENLRTQDSIFSYEIYDNVEMLEAAVVKGEIECGFVIKEGFEKKLKENKQQNSVTMLTTNMSTKKEVFQEAFYAALLKEYSQWLLEESEESIYGYKDAKITEILHLKNQEYLNSDAVYHINVEEVAVEQSTNKETKDLSLQAVIGILCILVIFMASGKQFDPKMKGIYKALNKKELRYFKITGYVAQVTLMAIIGTLLIIFSSRSRGLFVEIVSMVIFLMMNCVWTLLLSERMKSAHTLGAWVLVILVVNLLVSPTLIDLALYVPAVKYISYLFPMGMYLRI